MNYKITTTVLALILVLTYALNWNNIFSSDRPMNMQMQGMHQMPDGKMMGNGNMSMNDMMMDMTANMKGKTGKELEKAFLEDMIIHHQGAIDMAKELLKGTTKPELVKMGNDIVTVQSKEIDQMKEWLKSY